LVVVPSRDTWLHVILVGYELREQPPIPDSTTKLVRPELWRRGDAWALQVIRWARLGIAALPVAAFVLRYFNVWQHLDVWIRARLSWKMSTR